MINDEAAAFIVMILKRFDFSVTVLFLNPLLLFLTSYCYVFSSSVFTTRLSPLSVVSFDFSVCNFETFL
jgi:hypothetical protein